MIFTFLATVNQGVLEPKELDHWLAVLGSLNGQKVIVKIDPAVKTDAQLRRYRKVILPAITEHHNRHLSPGEPPKSQDEVHYMLKRAFIGVEPVDLKPKSSSTLSKSGFSHFMDEIQSYYSNLGVHFDTEERFP